MATNNKKAIDIMAQLSSLLQLRWAGSFFTAGFDTDGLPTLLISQSSTETAGQANVFIKVALQPWALAKDVFGNTANQYAPHVIQVVTEANPTGGAGADILTPDQLLKTWVEVIKPGAAVQWWQSAAGAAPTVTTLGTASNLKSTVYPDVYNPLRNQI